MIVIRWLIACAVIFGGLAWAARLVRRISPAGGGPPGPLARLGALALGPRRTLLVVRVGDEIRALIVHERGVLDLGAVAGWPAASRELTPATCTPPSLPAVLLGSRGMEWLARLRGTVERLTASPLATSRDITEDEAPSTVYGPGHPDWLARQRLLQGSPVVEHPDPTTPASGTATEPRKGSGKRQKPAGAPRE